MKEAPELRQLYRSHDIHCPYGSHRQCRQIPQRANAQGLDMKRREPFRYSSLPSRPRCLPPPLATSHARSPRHLRTLPRTGTRLRPRLDPAPAPEPTPPATEPAPAPATGAAPMDSGIELRRYRQERGRRRIQGRVGGHRDAAPAFHGGRRGRQRLAIAGRSGWPSRRDGQPSRVADASSVIDVAMTPEAPAIGRGFFMHACQWATGTKAEGTRLGAYHHRVVVDRKDVGVQFGLQRAAVGVAHRSIAVGQTARR